MSMKWYAEQPAMGFSAMREKGTGRLIFALAHPSSTYGDQEASDEEKYAWLRLIAAAPELLEACQYMHKLLVDMGHGGLAGAILGANAIAKAEGGA